MPDIKKLCQDFRKISLTPEHHIYRESVFSEIDEYCDTMVDTLKQEIYFNHPNSQDCLLDHHKIIAVHIWGILKNQPFLKERCIEGDTYFDILPNEHYCLLLIQVLLLGWHKSYDRTISIKMPCKYKDCLLLLFRKYRQSRSPQTDDVVFAYALANIVYLIDSYFVSQ